MKKFMGKILALSMSIMMVLSLAACSNSDSGSGSKEGGKIGVAMPTKDLQRWTQDGENMKKDLEKAGYKVDLQYANNDIATQVSQIENMITGGCELLVIASIDGSSLSTVLQQAKSEEIPVIAYDRLIMDSDAVSYYATFDNYKVGQIQGKYIVDTLKLDEEKGPFNIELFTGAPDDNNCHFFFGGAMDVLQPYIDKGTLAVSSGQTKFEEVATPNWSTEESQKRMDNILTANYTGDKKVDVVLSSNDSVANGITNALKAGGYTKDNFPVLTGQDCDITSVKNILAGTQSMSVFKDTRKLAGQVVTMIGQIMSDEKVDVNDEKSYDNGKGVVPTFLCEPEFADASNYKKLLIDSGYYTEDQLK